jgi:hypothetical protein
MKPSSEGDSHAPCEEILKRGTPGAKRSWRLAATPRVARGMREAAQAVVSKVDTIIAQLHTHAQGTNGTSSTRWNMISASARPGFSASFALAKYG